MKKLFIILVIGALCFFIYKFFISKEKTGTVMVTKKSQELEYSLRAHVEMLSEKIGERSYANYENLMKAAKYIEEQFGLTGYKPDLQYYTLPEGEVKNIIATKKGSKRPEEIVIIGAHYDTRGNPGADDNASGIAGLLEIASFMADKDASRTVKFIAFTNEEPPFFKTSQMGSRVYASLARQTAEKIKAAMILEMIGYYSDEPGSQMYPPLFSLFFPDKGNFIAFVGNLDSRSLVKQSVRYFKRHSSFPLEWISSVSGILGFDFSDHWSFWEEGYKAFMVTDTAFYRNRNYHQDSDTYETLDFARMSDVVHGLSYTLLELANE